jgi:hypothetical protein
MIIKTPWQFQKKYNKSNICVVFSKLIIDNKNEILSLINDENKYYNKIDEFLLKACELKNTSEGIFLNESNITGKYQEIILMCDNKINYDFNEYMVVNRDAFTFTILKYNSQFLIVDSHYPQHILVDNTDELDKYITFDNIYQGIVEIIYL